jgi:hypothetical protein
MAVAGGVVEEDGGEGDVGEAVAMVGDGRMSVLGLDHGTSEMRISRRKRRGFRDVCLQDQYS